MTDNKKDTNPNTDSEAKDNLEDSVITYKDSDSDTPLVSDDIGLPRNKKILYIVLAVWAVAALAGYIYVQSNSGDSNTTQDSITAAEQAALDNSSPTASQKIATIGEAAPDFSVRGLDGDITLADYKDKPVLIEFIATWCPHCKKVAPRVKQALEIEPTDYLMVGAANEPDKKVVAFHDKYDLPGDVGFDDKDLTTIQLFQGTGYPTLVFLDKDHKVVSIKSGEPTVSELVSDLEAINGK